MARCGAVLLLFAAPTSRALFNVAALTLIVGWLLSGQYRQRLAIAWSNPITMPVFLMIGVILIGSLQTTASMSEVLDHWERYSKFLLIPLMISVLDSERWRQWAWASFIAAMLITLISTYLNIWVDIPWSKTHNAGWGNDHSVFANHIAQGLSMAFFFAVCALRGLSHPKGRWRLVWLVTTLLAALSITHLSQGRTGQVALVGVVLVLALRESPPMWRWRALVATMFLLTLLFVSSPLLQQRFGAVHNEIMAIESGNDYSSSGARLRMWAASIELIKEAPLFGHGTGSYHRESERVFNDAAMCEIGCFHPHNQLLFFGVEHGVVGMVLFLFFLWRPLLLGIQRSGQAATLLICFMTVLIVDVFVHGPLWIHMEAYFFFTVLALLMAESIHFQRPVSTST